VVKSLYPLPVIAVRLMRLVSTDDVIFRRAADLIRADAAFSAEVMRLANSPLLGCRESVHGVLHAMAILGLDRLKGLVMTVALRNLLSSTLQVPVLLRCWRHTLASALVCEELATACWLDKDKLYTAGLMHDLGRLALLATYPEDYAQLLKIADEAESGEFDLLSGERDRFDADHTQVGSWLAEDWGFPSEYREITGHHHEPPRGGRFDLHTAVHLGCRIADMLGFQVAGPAPLVGFDELKVGFPACSWERVKPEHGLLHEIAGRINALECSLL
jgi:putative nucleotidyltransferase with HDIG domain